MDLLRRAFRDIAAGHTRGLILGRTAYIRHLSDSDQCDLDQKREEFLEEAREIGLPTDEARLAMLRAAGQWSEAKDRELDTARRYITDLREGQKKNAHMPSMVKGYAQRIADAEKDYHTKTDEKRRLMGLTCDVSADREVNDYYIVTNVFADPGLSVPLFPPGEFAYLKDGGPGGVGEIVAHYNAAMEGVSERNVKRLAMQPWFQKKFQLAGDDYTTFFGCPICDLTFYQVDLLRFGAHFRHIYSSHDVSQFPKNVLEDPDLLTDYATAAAKGKEQLQQQGAHEEGAMVVGLKSEDSKAMGVKTRNPMSEIVKNFGGNVLDWAAKRS